MAKKTKDAAASAKKEVKPKGPVDIDATKSLIRLLNILALLLAIAAFLLQLFAVLSHHWKWQTTDLHNIIATHPYARSNVYDDSRLDQHYGLYSRDVKLYANHDEQLDLWTSTRFPRIDDNDENNFHRCLSQTSTLRGALLTCSDRVVSLEQCHCRRYPYWNFVIAFEIIALILLGIVVFLTALFITQFQSILKPAAAGLALLAFILLLIGLILILSHLKRETRTLADAYPHVQQRLANKLAIDHAQDRAQQHHQTVLRRSVVRRVVLRQQPDHYRAYSLLPGQHPYNDTHYQEYSDQANAWLYKPYATIAAPAAYASLSQQREGSYVPHSQQQAGAYAVTTRRGTTVAPVHNQYGPVLGYDNVFDNTRAGIGWSTILSILAMILSLLLPLLIIFSWLKNKDLEPDVKKKGSKTEYVSVPQHDITVQAVPPRPIPVTYSPNSPIGDAIATTHHVNIQPPPPPRSIPVNYNPNNPMGDAIATTHHVSIQPAPPPGSIPGNYSSDRPVGDATGTTHHPPHHPPLKGYDSPAVPFESLTIVDVPIPSEAPITQTTQYRQYPGTVESTQTTRRT